MMKRNTAQTALEDVGDAFGTVISTGTEAFADITPDLEDIADAAIDTVAATGRISIRIVTGTIRFVARHPREVLIGAGLVAVCVVVLRYLSSSSSSHDAS